LERNLDARPSLRVSLFAERTSDLMQLRDAQARIQADPDMRLQLRLRA
jgi:hypothetical protein